MVYDNYLDLKKYDLVPFINPMEEDYSVYRVNYNMKNEKNRQLRMWIQRERDEFNLYLYVISCRINNFGYEYDYYDLKIVNLINHIYGRASAEDYYAAGMKAAIFGKDIINKVLPFEDVDWNDYKVFKKTMTEKLFFFADSFEKEEYFFDEAAILKKSEPGKTTA